MAKVTSTINRGTPLSLKLDDGSSLTAICQDLDIVGGKKILLVSDLHGNDEAFRLALSRVEHDLVLVLGDSGSVCFDEYVSENIMVVGGNNDELAENFEYSMLQVSGMVQGLNLINIIGFHGDRWFNDDPSKGWMDTPVQHPQTGQEIYVYGHIHTPVCAYRGNSLLVSPGYGAEGQVAQLLMGTYGFRVRFVELNEQPERLVLKRTHRNGRFYLSYCRFGDGHVVRYLPTPNTPFKEIPDKKNCDYYLATQYANQQAVIYYPPAQELFLRALGYEQSSSLVEE